MSRVMAFIASLCVAVFAVLPGRASAWDSNSFVGDSVEFYSYEPVMSLSSAGASVLSDSASSDSVTGFDFISLFSLASGYEYCFYLADYYWPREVIGGVSVGGYSIPVIAPSPGYSTYFNLDSHNITFGLPDGASCPVNVTEHASAYLTDVTGLAYAASSGSSGADASDSVKLSLNISSFGSFSSFSLDGSLLLWSFSPDYSYSFNGGSISLYVNDAFVHRFYASSSSGGVLDFASFIYSGSVPVTSISFVVSPDWGSISVSEGDSFDLPLRTRLDQMGGVQFSVLSGDTVLDGFNDEGQDAINQEDALQSQWGGSMVDNFNALNVGSFSYPDGLMSAFSLVSGIFQDIWSSFGDYALLWVFPLTLAIVLLVIGRISKTAGRGHKAEGGGD